MSVAHTSPDNRVNGVDVDALHGIIDGIRSHPEKAAVGFQVTSSWTGNMKSRHVVEGFRLGDDWQERHFTIEADEPRQLLGTNTALNPQELLMSALNACIMAGYVTGAAANGIRLDSVEIETEGELDLRGFLGVDPEVKPGYDAVRYTVHIKGDGTPEQFRDIHETVMRTSPNFFNLSSPVRIEARLDVVK